MGEPTRDPDAILARLQAEDPEAGKDAAAGRGQLKIVFGYAAGVGKTYGMLEGARAAALAGHEVVLGYIEPHGRPETVELLLGQEMLPLRDIDHRGVKLREFDLDGALRRRPELLLVDELAHTNAPGSRHSKRWQDVEELLAAGINVWTTLNVQHLESLNDIVAQITGIVVRETVPDRLFDEAATVELIDLPPGELLDRLREGKVYVPAQAQRAVERFFRQANLVALRELAVRRVADRVSREVQTARRGQTRTRIWATSERLLVCVGPSPTSAKVIRTARRLATALQAQWIAVHAETPATARLDDRARQQLTQHLRLAQRLGAETVTLAGLDVADELVRYARSRNVTKIVIGKTGQTPWYRIWRRSIVDRLIALSGEIDVYVIHGDDEEPASRPRTGRPRHSVRGWAAAAAVLALATGAAAALRALGLAETNLVMTYLLAVVLVAAEWGRGPAVASSVGAVLLYNLLFTPPYYTLRVGRGEDVHTLAGMLIVGLLVGTLTARVRALAALSRDSQRRTAALYGVSQRLAGAAGVPQVVAGAQEQVAAVLGGQVQVLVPEAGALRPLPPGEDAAPQGTTDVEAARWVWQHGQTAGRGTDTLPAARALYLPLPGADTTVGVLSWEPAEGDELLSSDRRQLLEAFAAQIALALERERLAREAEQILADAQTEHRRAAVLHAVSHDLRTPLAAITGAATTLRAATGNLEPAQRAELLDTICEEADRLERLVRNLLDMTRLESGALQVHRDWVPMEEVVGSALTRLEARLAGRPVAADVPADLPLVSVDPVLLEQVLVNLLENACKYTPGDSPIDIRARAAPGALTVEVADRGPGLPPGEVTHLFDRFVRGPHPGVPGAGLGLAICRGIVEALGGTIEAENREGGGALFRITLSLVGQPPGVPGEPGAGNGEDAP